MDFFCLKTIGCLRFAVFSCISIAAAFEDIRTLRVARRPLFILIAFLVFFPDDQWPASCAERAGGGIAALASFGIGRFVSANKLGLADVWMATAIGALGGPAFFAQSALAAIILMLPAKKGCACPFIPALVAGTVLSVFFSPFFGHA